MFPEFLRRSTLKMVGSPPSVMLGLAPTITRQVVLSGTHGWHHTNRPPTTGAVPYGSRNLIGTQPNVVGGVPQQPNVVDRTPQQGGFFVAGRKRPFGF